jgi:hypothetical protein
MRQLLNQVAPRYRTAAPGPSFAAPRDPAPMRQRNIFGHQLAASQKMPGASGEIRARQNNVKPTQLCCDTVKQKGL